MVLRKNNDKYDKFDGAEEFIQIKTEEICSQEKLSVEEVKFIFVYILNFSVYVLLLAFLASK